MDGGKTAHLPMGVSKQLGFDLPAVSVVIKTIITQHQL